MGLGKKQEITNQLSLENGWCYARNCKSIKFGGVVLGFFMGWCYARNNQSSEFGGVVFNSLEITNQLSVVGWCYNTKNNQSIEYGGVVLLNPPLP